MSKHENYEILNLIGYGLSKFNNEFVKEMGYTSKDSLYKYLVGLGVAETTGTIKNRQDLFDQFFNNGRKGWWQKGDIYIHRKILIDSLFGELSAKHYTDMIKSRLAMDFKAELLVNVSPILSSKFKQLQETGLEAEEYFKNNYQSITLFQNGTLEDARLYGDGYDFQITVQNHFYLAEIKGVRQKSGGIRLTQNEYNKALDYNSDYILTIIANLVDVPKIIYIPNPIKELELEKKIYTAKEQISYHSKHITW